MSTYVDARSVAKATRSPRTRVKPTGVFGAHRAPDYKGRDDVRVANLRLAADARQELRSWKRGLTRKQRSLLKP
jgi:hypothetical protein